MADAVAVGHCGFGAIVARCGRHHHRPALALGDHRLDRRLENLVYTDHLFT